MVGGGTASMRPGEVSLANGGVLFLDELGEFQPAVLDGLRQPLEEGVVRVTRARAAVQFPARFQLVAAMNPCPCGAGGQPGACRCGDAPVTGTCGGCRARCWTGSTCGSKWLAPGWTSCSACPVGEPSARGRRPGPEGQGGRHRPRATSSTAPSPVRLLDEVAPVTKAARLVLRRELEAGRLSGRGLHRVRRVARTLADVHECHGAIDEEWVSHRAQPAHRSRSSRPAGQHEHVG